MGLRPSRRQASAAAVVATFALTSLAGYALALSLPVPLPGIELEVPVDLPDPLISPPKVELPENPIIGSPDGDELAEIGEILDPGPAFPVEPPPAQTGIAPARSRPAPQGRGVPGVVEGVVELVPNVGDLTRDDMRLLEDLGLGDLVDLAESAEAARNNNNNIKVIVERSSDGNTNTIRQRTRGDQVVTCVEGTGDSTDTACNG